MFPHIRCAVQHRGVTEFVEPLRDLRRHGACTHEHGNVGELNQAVTDPPSQQRLDLGDEIIEYPLLHAPATGLPNPNTFRNVEVKTVRMARLNVMHLDGAMA